LPIYAKKRENYATDVEQFHDLYRQMVDHKNQFEKKVEERTTELAKVNEKLDKMTAYINDLKNSIGSQEFSIHDIHKMESELKGLAESTDRAIALRDQKRKSLFAAEAKLSSICNDLDSKVAEFSGKIAELRLVPELGSKFHKMQASVNKEKLLHDDLRESLGVDLVGHIQPLAQSTKEEYIQKVDDTKDLYHKIMDQTNHLEDSCKEAEAKLKITNDKVLKYEQTLESERKTQDATVAVREREVESIETKIASLQDPVALEEQMAAYERQCAELQALRLEREENNMAQKRAVLIDINHSCQIMAEHDAYLEKQISELKQYSEERTRGIGKVVIPSNMDKKLHT
jgi:kinetochore protein NDC80